MSNEMFNLFKIFLGDQELEELKKNSYLEVTASRMKELVNINIEKGNESLEMLELELRNNSNDNLLSVYNVVSNTINDLKSALIYLEHNQNKVFKFSYNKNLIDEFLNR